jgi:uncharacterized protein involved in outer membrane biogenesis
VTNDATRSPKPGSRRPSTKPQVRPAERRPMGRAGTWTHERWTAARERLSQVQVKAPSKKTMYWAGGVLAVLAIAIAILVAIWDWNWFRGPVARYASMRLHREVTITGDLRVHPWSWQPSATVDGVHVANPKWAPGGPQMADIDRIAVTIRLLPLITGDVDLRLLRFDRPHVVLYRDLQGRATWDFSDGKKKDQPMRLPPIRNFIISDGRLKVTDAKRKLTFEGTVNAAEQLGVTAQGFELKGQGHLNAQPFTAQVVGGPLLNIDKDKPYPFDADIRSGDTYITARGAVPKPFDLGQFYMNTTARGPDLADLYTLTGVALPNTPPYSLHGRLSREDTTWYIKGLGGRVGDSDLMGDLSVKTAGERPFLKADLRSKSLDFDDLGAIFGGAPSTTAGETASPTQKAVASTLQAEQRIFPDSTLKVDRVRAMDADVTYKALSIRDAPIHLKSGSVRVKLNAGVLRAEPVTLQLPQGQVAGYVQLDARKATPVTNLDLKLTNARLEQLIPVKIGGRVPFSGSLVGRAKLTGTGNSVHKAMANADGEVMVVIPGGEIREAFAELAGVDVVKGLGLLLSKNQETTPIRCGVAHFQAVNGVFTADRIVFDTGPVLVTGGGSITMGDEKLNLKAQGHPKKFQLVRVILPVTAQGSLLRPKLGVQPGAAAAQGGAAVALGAFLTPLAAILPFIDPGLAKDANCTGLIAEAGQHGAPVKAVARR